MKIKFSHQKIFYLKVVWDNMIEIFQAFRPGVSIWHICHVVRHGHFTLKQLRLSVLNEMHTSSYTGPRLLLKFNFLFYPSLIFA